MLQLWTEHCNQDACTKAFPSAKASLNRSGSYVWCPSRGENSSWQRGKGTSSYEDAERKEKGFSLPASTLINLPHKLHWKQLFWLRNGNWAWIWGDNQWVHVQWRRVPWFKLLAWHLFLISNVASIVSSSVWPWASVSCQKNKMVIISFACLVNCLRQDLTLLLTQCLAGDAADLHWGLLAFLWFNWKDVIKYF